MDAPATDTAFFGHPRGLAYLAFTEAWERFSYYGMTALLALYMVQQLLAPGHVEPVLGLAALRRVFEASGPITDQAFASLIFGWYSGLVYFTPILGGWIADRWFGTKASVVLGALLMSAGHIAMAFDASFLIALALLICGSGCLKGNISAQVGHLYPPHEESRRTRGYAIFSAGINAGAVVGPLVCGGLAAAYGWHIGFGCAGALMLVALATYLAGGRYIPGGRKHTERIAYPPLTPAERRRAWALIAVIALTVLPNIAYPMIWNIGIVWVNDHATLGTAFGEVPASWFNSIDAFASVVSVPPLVAFWHWQAKRGREPGEIVKIGIGSALVGASAAIFALGSFAAGTGKVAAWWPLAGFFGMGIAFLWFWPVLLALVSQAAPAKVNATLMGVAFLSLFAGSVLMGWIGTLYSTMGPTAFWLVDAAIGLAGAILTFALRRGLDSALTKTDST